MLLINEFPLNDRDTSPVLLLVQTIILLFARVSQALSNSSTPIFSSLSNDLDTFRNRSLSYIESETIRIETLYFKVHSNHKRLEDAYMYGLYYSYHTCMGNEDPSYLQTSPSA